MAREYNIDLAQVRGTGAGGRITKQDVEAYMASQGARTVSQAAPTAPIAPPRAPQAPPQAPPPPMPRAEAAKTRV
jgi:2-oxoglutarate dehydrogenase E2 component (dihydrolipoamide succinyltransferase)